jgi:hypothetical protein
LALPEKLGLSPESAVVGVVVVPHAAVLGAILAVVAVEAEAAVGVLAALVAHRLLMPTVAVDAPTVAVEAAVAVEATVAVDAAVIAVHLGEPLMVLPLMGLGEMALGKRTGAGQQADDEHRRSQGTQHGDLPRSESTHVGQRQEAAPVPAGK